MSIRASRCDDPAGTEPEGTYAVGYGRPPKHTRFKPGQSGNYSGRPKGSRNLHSGMCKVLTDPVIVSEGGKRRRVPAIEALYRVMLQRALKGDLRAALFVLKSAKEFGLLDETKMEDYSDCIILDDAYLKRLSVRSLDEIIQISKEIEAQIRNSKKDD